jgi:uncharacterized protein (DUF2267 family)
MAKTLALTNQQDEFLQNILQTWVNVAEPKSNTELALAQGILQAMREPAAPPAILTDAQDEFLQRVLLDFQFQTNLTVNSSRSQEAMIRALLTTLQEP